MEASRAAVKWEPPCAGLRDAVRSAVSTSADARMMRRLLCVLLVHEHCPATDVARWLGVHRRTLQRWLASYRLHGRSALAEQGRRGRPPRLAGRRARALRHDLDLPPGALGYSSCAWTGRLLRTHLAGRYRIKLSLRQCQRLLRRRPPQRSLELAAR